MAGKPNLLIIADYNRKDYVDLFNACRGSFNFYFLYHTSRRDQKNEYYKTYGQAMYWQDFSDVFALLYAIKPAKVVFFYIATYNQLVLNLACRIIGIPTYQLEHGLRADYVLGFDPATSPKAVTSFFTKLNHSLTICRDIPARIRNRLFLTRSIRLLPPADAAFAQNYIQVRKKYNFLETWRQIPSEKRTADHYISFSRKIFQIHQQEDALPANKKVDFIGIPYYDHLAKITLVQPPVKSLLLIDQPLAEQCLLGWTPLLKATFNEQLCQVCQQLGYSLLVKPHPVQDLTVWQKLSGKYNVQLISDAAVAELAPRLRVVLGFYSTYLLPFAAFDHMALLSFEKHPSGKLMISRIFTEAGVGRAIFNLQELYELLPDIETLHRQQLPHKKSFIEDWLYKFDGQSGERLKSILLAPHQIV